MKKVVLGSRILVGLMFVVFGLNGFLNFIPNPPMSAEAGALMGAFAKTGYFFPMIKTLEIVIGLFILTNIYLPLAIVALTPILIGITSIHVFLNPAGLPMMIIVHILHGILVYGYRSSFKGLLSLKAKV